MTTEPLTITTEHDTIPVVNPHDHAFYDNLYCMWFGAVGTTKLYVWARSFDDALEECVATLARGYFSEPDYLDAARDEYAERESVGWEAGDHEGSRWARTHAAYPDGADPFQPYSEDIDEDEWREAVQERAETDHTYTEAGWLLSWEWGGAEITDAAEYDRVKAACCANATNN